MGLPVTWFEINGPEPTKAGAFYVELFGWHTKSLLNPGKGIPGGIGSSQTGQPTSQVYAQVDDLQKYVERAGSLGGKIAVQPMSVGEDTSIALFLDPQGTLFGLYVHQH